jgi:hypothetical protein
MAARGRRWHPRSWETPGSGPIGQYVSAHQTSGAVFRIASIWANNRVSSTGLVW